MANASKPGPGEARVGTLSDSSEDYLEIILQLQLEKRVARVRDIASRKGVSNASVSNALHRLARDGFVNHEAHEFVELTERGLDLARRVLRRHEFLVSFFSEVLLVPPGVAQSDACAIKHHVSAETLERLALFYLFVSSCPRVGVNLLEAFKACCERKDACMSDLGPHGCANVLNVPPRRGPECIAGGLENELVPLSDLPPGEVGIVVRFKAPAVVRKHLVDVGLLPNVVVEVRRVGPERREVQLSVQGCDLVLDSHEAAAVLVRPVKPLPS